MLFIVSGTVLGTPETAVNKMNKYPCPHVASSHSVGGRHTVVSSFYGTVEVLWKEKARVRITGRVRARCDFQ